MIKIEDVDVWGFEHAIRGMRNSLNSWDKSDSGYQSANFCDRNFIVGENDLDLMKRLFKASLDQNHAHRKYLGQIMVSMDVTAPLYWWSEFDTYKVGTVSSSCSTMHKIAAKEFTLDDFSCEHLYVDRLSAYCPKTVLEQTIKGLNFWRCRYLETNRKHDWWQLIQLLPSSYNQKKEQ